MVKFEFCGENGYPTLMWKHTRCHQKDFPRISFVYESTDLIAHGYIINRTETLRKISVLFVREPNRASAWDCDPRVSNDIGNDWSEMIFYHPDLKPVRTHRKKRIAKKYLKRYGVCISNLVGSDYGIGITRDGNKLCMFAYNPEEESR